MNIGERIKLLRKALCLTQVEFAQRIGLKGTAIGLYESGNRTVTERSIVTICKTFNVNENWLRDGTGEMYNDSEGKLTQDFSLDDLGQAIIKGYSQLNNFEKAAIGKYIKAVAKEYETAENDKKVDKDIEKEVEAYRHELESEKSTQTSSALQNANDSKIV